MVEWKKIEDLGSYFGGLTGKTKKDFEDGNAKFITYMNVFANPSLDESTVGMVHINEGEKQNRVQKGDILFTGSSETPDEAGMSCVVTDDLLEDYYMNSFCFGLRLNNPEQFNLHYLKHLLRSYSIRSEISKTASGVTRFNISKARFGKVLIPVPSIDEQSRIVGILDTFTASIENLKQQIAQRRKQYEHYRDQLLDLEGKEGVEMKTLGEIGKCKAGATPSTKKTEYWVGGNIPWMSSGEVHQKVVTHTASYITKKGYENASTKMLPVNTVVIALAGQGKTRGSVAITAIELCTNQSLCGVIINNGKIVNKYVYHYLLTRYNDLRRISSGDGTRGGLNLKMISSYPIPIPSTLEQQRIVSILDTFEASIANLEQQLAQREKQYEYYRNKLLTFE